MNWKISALHFILYAVRCIMDTGHCKQNIVISSLAMDIVPGFFLLLCLSFSSCKVLVVKTKDITDGTMQKHDKNKNSEAQGV